MNVLDELLHFRSIGISINQIMILITSSYFNDNTKYIVTVNNKNISTTISIFKQISKVRKESFNPRCRRYTAVTCISSYVLLTLLVLLLLLIIQPMNANNPFQSSSLAVNRTMMNSSSNTHHSIDRMISVYDSNNVQKNDNDKINIQTDATGNLSDNRII